MLDRLALFLGGLVAVLLTPAFALSYFLSYDEPDESPRAWLAQLQEPLTDAGLLHGGSTSAYDRYGLLYLVASALALAGLVGLLLQQWSDFPPRVRRAWAVLVTGLGLVEFGILGDYGVPSDIVGGVGFVLTGLGFLIAAAVAGCSAGRCAETAQPARGPPSGWALSAWSLCLEGWHWSGTSHPDLVWGSLSVRCS